MAGSRGRRQAGRGRRGPKSVAAPASGAWRLRAARALILGIAPGRFWNDAGGEEADLYEAAFRERQRAAEEAAIRGAWWAALWSHAGPPKWAEVEEMLSGKPATPPTAEALLAKAKSFGVGSFMTTGEAARG